MNRSPAFPSPAMRLSDRVAFWIAVAGGAGLVRVWPGTVGSALGVGAVALLSLANFWLAVLFTAASFPLGVWASSRVEAAWKTDDPQFVVVDEVFGAAATVLLLPGEPLWLLAGFAVFRFFDAVKPWPAGLVHRHVRGGLGIMLDDALAAAMAALVLLAANGLIPRGS